MLEPDSPLAVQVTEAIHHGELEALGRLLGEHPGLATERIGDEQQSRSLLHIVTDWPGNFPNGAAVVRLLVDAGADVGARFVGAHAETPLHWAASCDDVAVLDTLLDAGADIEATGGVVASGTPLADAVVFGQWAAARRLVERGATVELWQAAALGPLERVQELIGDLLTNALWCAGHGGQREVAEHLVARGADPTWVGHDRATPADAAERSGHHELAVWLRAQAG